MLDYRIDTFLTVCRLLNYTKAAEELHITQPAVSQHIRYLEDYYEVQLIHFDGKRLCLTEEGRLLRNAATTVKHDEIILREQMKTGKRRTLVFGATLTIGDFVLPGMLARYINSSPETEVKMTVDNTETLLKQIDSGELDFAVIEGYFHKAEYDYKIYSIENYIAVCGSSYAF